LALLLISMLAACQERSEEGAQLDAEHALEERVLAPCCWRQSLRDHESELASSLRAEISARLRAEESASAIEDDLVRRYGERIRALPAESDPRWILVAAFAAFAGMGLYAISRLVRRPPSQPSAAAGSGVVLLAAAAERERTRQLAYEQRLEDELSVVD
jgi:cytochrome c-type biogenesis protein CcmH